MLSDINYDIFDYGSSQDVMDIDYQIDVFEIRQSIKFKKHSKAKLKQSPCPISAKKLKSQPSLLKINCQQCKQTSKAESKPFRYQCSSVTSKKFECGQTLKVKSRSTKSSKQSKPSKKLNEEDLTNFNDFRRHFYQINRKVIKSSFDFHSNIKVANIRLASVDKSVQNDFMKRLNRNSAFFPQLVYHGTKLQNIPSILQFGFLLPNQAHPTNKNAPIIQSVHGQAFGRGIYCSRTAHYSLAYTETTNTLLVCAAIPKYKKMGRVEYFNENILVLNHESQIIPLYLVDFNYLNGSGINRPLFYHQRELQNEKNEKDKNSMIISKKYLRKVLNVMNDHVRKNNQYQMRIFDPLN